MAYTSINISYNEGTLCEEINFSEPGEHSYTLGSIITLSDPRLSRDRSLIVKSVNYTEDESSGLSTDILGFSTEYIYTRKAPDCDISFFTMTSIAKGAYEAQNPNPDSEVFIMLGDWYGVGGWSMHSIINKIVTEWMGLNVQNTLPDFWISDYTISLGSTFFEAVTSLISEFEPLIILSGGTLYILERSGAGAFHSGRITPTGFTTRSVNKEHVPVPGCVKTEGQEGRYIAEKDPAFSGFTYYAGGLTSEKEYSGTVIAPDKTMEIYYILEVYEDISAHDDVLIYRKQSSRLTDPAGHTSYIETVSEYEYISDILVESVETCKAEIARNIEIYNIVSVIYEHDANWNLIGQITSKQELFIYNWDTLTYVKYDPRDYDLDNLDEYEGPVLIASEIRTTKYSRIDSETYGVETVIASKVYNEEEEEWQTLYTFEHDIVEAGGQQRNSRGNKDINTLQVYAGGCPVVPELSVMDEPAKIFNIPTPDWDSIEDCHVYLAALVSQGFQKATATTPIIDPLPLMSIGGLGNIMEAGAKGEYYIKGYTINIDPDSGHTTELDLEAQSA